MIDRPTQPAIEEVPDPPAPPDGCCVREVIERLCGITPAAMNRFVVAGMPRKWHEPLQRYVYNLADCECWLRAIGAMPESERRPEPEPTT